jgi:HSP20 family protein
MTLYTLPLTAVRTTSAVRRDLDRLFDDAFGTRAPGAWQPSADAREDATGYTIAMDLPGVSPDSLEVLAEDGALTVRGTRPVRELAAAERMVFAERPRGAFVRRFRLPKAADLQSVSATFEHGVLQVRIAKVAPAQPRRVPVTVATGASDVTHAPEPEPGA